MNPETKIGDFSKPLVERKTVATPPAAAKAPADKLDVATARLDQEQTDTEQKLDPMKKYEEQLKELGVSREEAAVIVDSVLLKGYWAEDITLTPRVKVRYRTRSYRDTKRLQDYIERVRPTYQTNIDEIMLRFFVASSIEQFGNDVLTHPKKDATGEQIEASFDARLAYIDNLPDPTMRLLFSKINRFDRKVQTCLQEGAIENF